MWHTVLTMLTLPGLVNSSCNPFIYALRLDSFRQPMLHVLRCKWMASDTALDDLPPAPSRSLREICCCQTKVSPAPAVIQVPEVPTGQWVCAKWLPSPYPGNQVRLLSNCLAQTDFEIWYIYCDWWCFSLHYKSNRSNVNKMSVLFEVGKRSVTGTIAGMTR